MHKPESQTRIARERIDELFSQAESVFKEHPTYSKRYVTLARKIAMKYRLSLKDHRRHFCKRCNSYLKQGVNSRIRLEHGNVILSCLECHHIRRFRYK